MKNNDVSIAASSSRRRKSFDVCALYHVVAGVFSTHMNLSLTEGQKRTVLSTEHSHCALAEAARPHYSALNRGICAKDRINAFGGRKGLIPYSLLLGLLRNGSHPIGLHVERRQTEKRWR